MSDALRLVETAQAAYPARGAEKRAADAATDEALAAYEALEAPDDALTYGVIRMLRAAGRYPAALALLQARRPAVDGKGRQLLFHEMELSFLAGRTGEAADLLARLEAGGPLRPSWVRAIARVQRKGAAAAAAEEPVSAESADPASLLNRVRAVHGRFPVREAQKYTVLATADELISEYGLQASPSDELTYAVVQLLRAMRRYPAALDLLAERRPQIPARAAEIDFLEVELLLRSRQREAGDRALQRFMDAGHTVRPTWKRTLAKLGRKFEALEARSELDALEASLAGLEAAVDIERHLPVLKPALPAHNHALEALLFIRSRMEALPRVAMQAQADLTRFDKYHSARLIFTCGFSWSGSGAVSCFLAQHRNVTLPFGTSEMAYLQGRDGRKGIFPFLAAGSFEPDAMRRLLATFFVESIVALSRPHFSVMTRCLAAGNGRIGVLGQLVDDFHGAMLAADALASVQVRRQMMGRFLQRLFSVLGGTHVLLNNVFLGPRIVMVGAMEDALFIVVERDARDQYIARKTESGGLGVKGLSRFAAMLRKGREKFEAIRRTAPPEHLERQMLLLRFEDVVREESTRLGILRKLGLDPAGLVPDLAKFDPSVSARNIGIHAGQLTPQECAGIERDMGIYLP